MAKTSLMLLVVLCGLVSFSLADPATMYGAAPAKYPSAPVPYPVKYEAPAPSANKYETPTTTYSPPTTTVKYETPKNEKKMEEYPMKTTEEKPVYKKEEYPTMKMKYGAPSMMRYRRAADAEKTPDVVEEEKMADPALRVSAAKKTSQPTDDKVTKLSAKNVDLLRDAVIESLLSDPIFLGRGLGFGGGGFYRPGGFFRRPSVGFGFGGGFRRPLFFDDEDDEPFF